MMLVVRFVDICSKDGFLLLSALFLTASSIGDHLVIGRLLSRIRITIGDDETSTFSTNIVLELELLRASGIFSD